MSIEHANRLSAKLYFASQPADGAGELLKTFQAWANGTGLPNEIGIDAVSYLHVRQGTRAIFVCHAGHYAADDADGSLGLSYRNKRDAPSTLGARVLDAARRAVGAAELAEISNDAIAFDANRLSFQVNDALHFDGSREALEALRTVVGRALSTVYEAVTVDLTPVQPGDTPGVTATNAADPVTLKTLASRIASQSRRAS